MVKDEKPLADGLNEFSKCKTCGKELVDMKIDGNLTVFYYSCGHKAGLVISNEVRIRTVNVTIEKYMNKDLDGLYSDLARIQDPTKLQVATASVIDFVKVGKHKLENFQEVLHKKICIEFEMCKKLDNLKRLSPTSQAGLIAQLIASITVTVIPWYLPAGLLASIWVKEGISKMCKCD